MKICQIKAKKYIILIFLFLFFLFFDFTVVYADALDASQAAPAAPNAINVSDVNTQRKIEEAKKVAEEAKNKSILDQIKTWAKDEAKFIYEQGAAQAYKTALRNFLNTLAIDTAKYLATGDKGEMAMFETDGWGGYLKNAADNAAGTFLQTLGENGPIKFNLCQPDFSVMLKINLGLYKTAKPKPPACTFSKMVDNWDQALHDKDFLPKFQDMFNPWSNDLGIALTLQTGIAENIEKDVDEAMAKRLQNEGYKDVVDPISGKIKTPSALVKEHSTDTLRKQGEGYLVYTGNAVADAIDIFINTLTGTLVEEWLHKGLVSDPKDSPNALNNLTDPYSQKQEDGISGADKRFASLAEPNFKVRGDYNILAELSTCPDPNKAGPTNCVIDEKFRQAIEQRLTVGQAVAQGYLNGNGVFGFTSDGLEPRYNEGYPYRSMLILRKFRIIPIGWEIAAQKIKDRQSEVGGTKNLNDLVNCSAQWCAGLVDPDWVLKAEQNFCKKQGAGPEILSEQITGQGYDSKLSILRNDNYCADEQSCVKEKADGSCQLYGYCTEERRKWDFNGKSCEPRDNTCQSFQIGDKAISYLQNTLDFGICNAGNAGCAKYSTSGLYYSSDKTVHWSSKENSIYLNKNAETCEAADQGCHGFVRIFPEKNETYDSVKSAGVAKAYERFASTGLIYEKLLPDYLKSSCYEYGQDEEGNIVGEGGGDLLPDAPAMCSDFARQCKQEEAGCELYSSQDGETKIPAKIGPQDYCPEECAGYGSFIQQATAFDASREAYFIPKTAKVCSAQAAGCEQFTNLDQVEKGGEGIEYYTYLRQCVKKSDNAAICAEFYNWEGSDESGYQLKVESLKTNGAEPAVISDDSVLCNKEIYNLSADNPAYNADCRQFYNRSGGIFYHLASRTISCSDNCHPYRKTISGDVAESDCAGGGVWNSSEKSCVYMAIPGQGSVCAANQVGCREYAGNTGNNMRNIFADDFADGTAGAWTGYQGSTAAPSSESISLDAGNKGNSLFVSGVSHTASRAVGNVVKPGKSYMLNFVSKGSIAPVNLNISFMNGKGEKSDFSPVSLNSGWNIFTAGLSALNHEVSADEIILIDGSANFYIDNIILTEITDRYYFIKNSWQTPYSCDADFENKPHPLFMLGCAKYTDRDSKIYALKSFSDLCSESAVGCELMIDTRNSSKQNEEIFTNSGTSKTVPADGFIYAVYDREKLCNSESKGCELLGKQYEYESASLYGDVYLKNNPDKYNQILCGSDAVGCQIFAYGKGEKYFKDPGDQACEWRRAANQGDREDWFKKKVKRCGNGVICLSNADCASGECQLETEDKPCPVSDNKTLGLGGVGGRVSQPSEDGNGKWAGICSAANSGCGEYIDPVSRFNTNLIFNGNFQVLADGSTDGWSKGLKQEIILEPNTVYRLARSSNAGQISLSGCSGDGIIYAIDAGNNLADAKGSITVNAVGYANSKIFYHKSGTVSRCGITAGNANGTVELKKAVIDYQLEQNVDSQTCNGTVDFDKGCVLFNQRSQAGASVRILDSDADTASFGSAASVPEKDSNIILKVAPDRTCDKWLACRSYVKDEKGGNTCYDIGLCDAVDDKGDCQSFVFSQKQNQTVENLGAEKISNLSGYAKAGIVNGSLGGDYYPFGAMKQNGEVVNLANGGFEYYGENGYPIGWNTENISWNANIFSVVDNPISAQYEGIGYAREGKSFLKLGSSYSAESEFVDVIPNTDYIITAYLNTKNLKSGQAAIDILSQSGTAIKSAAISQDFGADWKFSVGKFSSAGNSRMKIKLYASSGGSPGSQGNFYFDGISIRPAMNSKDNWNTTQSCRLYAENDALSCEYYEDSGNRQKGWYGYCLEYDRAPGNPNACILWYPVDKVKGDGIEEGAGYQNRAPAYYCLEAKPVCGGEDGNIPKFYCSAVVQTVTATGQNKFWSSRVYEGSDYEISFASSNAGAYVDYGASHGGKENIILKYSRAGTPFGAINPPEPANNPYEWDGASDDNQPNKIDPLFVWPASAGNIVSAGVPYYIGSGITCEKFTSGSYGDCGKTYSEKLGIWDKCELHSWNDDCRNNPGTYTQDGGWNWTATHADCCGDNQALTVTNRCSNTSSAKLASSYQQAKLGLQGIFAQSYGTWIWNDSVGRYIKDGSGSNDWGPPQAICSGARGANEYCAILPLVSNIKINGSSGTVSLMKNGFINLTFNSTADSQQLPLTMYAVDWGDGEKTTATGVEMRDRPNQNNPHSLYHLYSYWDLKAKANNGVGGISCSEGQCSVKPKIQIKDNWGWCSGGSGINDCGQWQSFGGAVEVKEK